MWWTRPECGRWMQPRYHNNQQYLGYTSLFSVLIPKDRISDPKYIKSECTVHIFPSLTKLGFWRLIHRSDLIIAAWKQQKRLGLVKFLATKADRGQIVVVVKRKQCWLLVRDRRWAVVFNKAVATIKDTEVISSVLLLEVWGFNHLRICDYTQITPSSIKV